MRYLLDTHILIWLISDPKQLSQTAKNIIQNTNNDLYYSPFSFCEIAIKVSNKKLEMADGWQSGYQKILHANDIKPIAQSWQDAVILQNLPFYHKDPFDRMLISLAMANNLGFINADGHCALYDLEVVW